MTFASPHPSSSLTCATFLANRHNAPPKTLATGPNDAQSDLSSPLSAHSLSSQLVVCKPSERCLRKPLKLIWFSFFGLPKLLLCSVCCKPFCFCSLPKLHSRLEGLNDDRRNHRTFDSRVTIPNPRKKKELLPSANSALRQESKLLALHSSSLSSSLLLSFSLIILSVDVALSNALFVLLAVWCVGVSCGH